MDFDKLFSVCYVLGRIEIENLKKLIFKDSTGIFKATFFIIEDNLMKYKKFNTDYLYPEIANEISATESKVIKFTKSVDHEKYTTVKNIASIDLKYEYVCDLYDKFQTEYTNEMFTRKMYEIEYLDKDLKLDIKYVSDDLELIGFIN